MMHIVNHKPGQERRERLEFLVLALMFLAGGTVTAIRVPHYAGWAVVTMLIGLAAITIGYGMTHRVYDVSTEGIVVIWYGRFSRRYRWDAFSEIGTFRVTLFHRQPENWLICSEIPIKKDEVGQVSSDWAYGHPLKVLCLTALTTEQEREFYTYLP